MDKTLFTAALLSAVASAPLQAADINVMAYNIMQLSVQDWDQSERAARLPNAIRTLPAQPDVILISEAFNSEAESALAALRDIYPYQTPNVGQDCSGNGWDGLTGNCSSSPFVIRGGVVALSKYPIVEQRAHVYQNSLYGSWDYMANKGFVYIKIEKEGRPFHLVGTHLQATHDGDTAEEHQVRLGQLGEIHSFINGLSIPASEPVIIGGDMNVEWSKQNEIQDMLQTSHATMQFDASGPGSFDATSNWHTRANAYYFDYDLDYNDSLDYLFWRQDHLQPVNQAVVQVVPLKADQSWYWSYLEGNWNLSTGPYYHNGYYRDLSDHYPVTVTLSYSQ